MPDPNDLIKEDDDQQSENDDGQQHIDIDENANEEKNEPVVINAAKEDDHSGNQVKEVDPQKQDKDDKKDDNDENDINDDKKLRKAAIVTDPALRLRTLKKKLVTEYKKKKDDEKKDIFENKVSHSNELEKNAKYDSIAEKLGYASAAGAGASAIGAYVAAGGAYAAGGLWTGAAGAVGLTKGLIQNGFKGAVPEARESVKKPWETTKGWGSEVINNQTSKDVFSSIGAIGSAAGAASAGVKMYSSIRRKKNDKNKNHREAAKRRAIASGFSMGSSLTGGLSHGADLGLFGGRATEEGSKSQKIGGALDIASGATGAVASGLDLWANMGEKEAHKNTARDAQNYSDSNRDSADESLKESRKKLKAFKNRKPSELSLKEMGDLRAARQERHTAKAQKYAMAQAAKIHKLRSEESTKGLIGTIGASIGGLGSILGGSLKIAGATGGLLGTIATGLSGIGGILKVAGGLTDYIKGKKESTKLANKNHELVEEYLNGKVEKIKQEAAGMDLKKGEERNLGEGGKKITDDEAKRIALMRLGIDIPDDTTDIPDKAYEMAFDKLTEKRANNIMKSGKEEKEAMLTTLGLDKDASLEDVIAVLKGN